VTGWAPAPVTPVVPYPPAPPRRPGTAVTACVLACVLAALSVPGAVATWWFSGWSDPYGELGSTVPRQGLVVALLEFAAVGALVTGAVLVVTGIDRWTLVVTSAAELGFVGWWLYQLLTGPLGAVDGDRLVLGGAAAVFGVLAVATGAFALAPSTARWLAVRRAARGR
jgi:hypothetical protein